MGLDFVFAVNYKHRKSKCAVGAAFEVCEFVIHHTLRFEGVVVRRKHIHIPDYWVGKSFGNQQLDILCFGEMEHDSALWYNLGANLRMVIDAESKIQCYKSSDALADVDVARNFVLVFGGVVGFVSAVALQLLPSVAAKVLIIKAEGDIIACKNPKILERCDAGDVVVVHIIIVGGGLVGGVSVVDVVVSPVVEGADCAVGLAVRI